MAKYKMKNTLGFFHAKALEYLINFMRNHSGAVDDDDIWAVLKNGDAEATLITEVKRQFKADEINALDNYKIRPRMSLGSVSLPEIVSAFWNHRSFRPRITRIVLNIIHAEQSLLSRPDDPEFRRFNEYCDFLNLDPLEREILMVVFLVEESKLCWVGGGRRNRCLNDNIAEISKFIDRAEYEVRNALTEKGRLRRYRCLDTDLSIIILNFSGFLYGIESKPFSSNFFTLIETPPLPWRFFGSLADQHGETLRRMIATRRPGRGINILLYGAPGTGKTSFARSLGDKLKLDCYSIVQNAGGREERIRSSAADRFSALQVCDSQVDSTRSLMIVDEADEMLRGNSGGLFASIFGGRSTSGDKGLLNSIMDNLETPCIWISNTPANALDESSRRRFDYSIRFEKLGYAQRLAIWKNSVRKLRIGRLVPLALQEKMAARYEVSAGGIAQALSNLADIRPEQSEAGALLEKLLDPHCELLHIPISANSCIVSKDYSLDGVNIKGGLPLPKIEAAIRRFLCETSGSGRAGADIPRMNLLLSGPPGTGKTEFVKYLGSVLNTPVMVRMGSDLLDMYVGGTEQRIKSAFAEAEASKAILFLDEVDGILQSRGNARHRWEVSQVNELLHRMENFKGVLICATNFATSLDAATMRRFTFKMTFDYLDDDGKVLFFERMFGIPLPATARRQLAMIPNLAPGDFRTVRQSHHYLGCNLTLEACLDGLTRESESKIHGKSTGGKIGFWA